MNKSDNTVWEAAELVQIKKGIQGRGDIGVVIGPATGGHWVNSGCLDILFHDGIRRVHPNNIQKPDGRTRLKQ